MAKKANPEAGHHEPGHCAWDHLRDLASAVLAGDWKAGLSALHSILSHLWGCETPPERGPVRSVPHDSREALANELRSMAAQAEADPRSQAWLDALLMLLPVVLEWLRHKPAPAA